MRLLITGATGSLGSALVRRLLTDGSVSRLVLYSRSESRQAALAGFIGAHPAHRAYLGASVGAHPALRFYLGDVRDRERLTRAMWSCEAVIHAAALKRVDSVADHPEEVRRTNIEGSANVTAAALDAGVAKVLLISSDKGVAPQNVYGVSKAQMEHEGIAFNAISAPRGTLVACTRYGNVLGSTGSVVHVWRAAIAAGRPIPMTDPTMTRFWLTLDQAASFVLWALAAMRGGEIFVPVLPAMQLGDLAEALAPGWPMERIGWRPGGEKHDEVLLTDEEGTRTVAAGEQAWAVNPSLHSWRADPPWTGDPWPAQAVYRSDLVPRLSVEAMRKLLEEVP